MDKMTYADKTLSNLAQDIAEYAKMGRKEGAKMCWFELVGASTMYGVFTDDDPNPVQRYAIPKLRAACENFDVSEEHVWNCIMY